MNWLKDNPFLAGLIGVTVVAVGALGFLLSEAMTHYQEASDGYDQAIEKLHKLQTNVPFPNEENLKKSQAVTAEYVKNLQGLEKQLSAMEIPLNPSVGPQQFQDDLRTAVNETNTKAEQAGVALPANFYLGFGQYANSLPSEKAAPYLARELTLIKGVVQQLIDIKIKSLDGLDRRPLAEETGAAVAAPSVPPGGGQPQGNNRRPRNGEAAAPSTTLEKNPFDLSFTAEQSKFRVAFNSLLSGKQFYIVRAIEVQNTQIAGPLVGGPESDASNNSSAPATGAEPPKSLNVILGQELVKATLRIEILHFDNASTPAK